MTSGNPLSDQEQLYILRWAGKKGWGDISRDIQKKYGDERKPQSLSRWYSNYSRTITEIKFKIPEDIFNKINTESEEVIAYLFCKTVENYLLAKNL